MPLPIPAAALCDELSRPVTGFTQVDVRDVRLADEQGLRPVLVVLAALTPSGPEAQPVRWRVSVQLDAEDLRLSPQAFVATIRANLEEWQQLKDVDPRVAGWAEPVR
ncbi:MAG: hypothetical protein JWM93_1082 [Frankiales bacterium]|nr:hypothetical protein [Frankiales bacterium]